MSEITNPVRWPDIAGNGRNQIISTWNTLPEHDFGISWNIENTWTIENSSVREAVGIHTAQGLEFDYACVIISDDLRMKNGQLVTNFTKRTKTDQSLKGVKKLAKEDPEKAHALADPIIRNTYRTQISKGSVHDTTLKRF